MKVAWCSECGKYIALDQSDECPAGHPKPCLRDIREVSHAQMRELTERGKQAGGIASGAETTASPSAPDGRSLSQTLSMGQGSVGAVWLVSLANLLTLGVAVRVPMYAFWTALALVSACVLTWVAYRMPHSDPTGKNTTFTLLCGVFIMGPIASGLSSLVYGDALIGSDAEIALTQVPRSIQYIPAAIWVLAYGVLFATRPWRGSHSIGPGARSADARSQRRNVVVSVAVFGVLLPVIIWAWFRSIGQPVAWWGFLAGLGVMLLCGAIGALELVWNGDRANLVDWRWRLAVSRPLMFLVAAVASAFMAVAIVGRTLGKGGMRLIADAVSPGATAVDLWLALACAGPVVLIASAWALYQLRPVGLFRRGAAARMAGRLFRQIDASPPAAEWAGVMGSRVDAASILLGTPVPQPWLIFDGMCHNGYVALSHGAPNLAVARSVVTELDHEAAVAMIAWLMLRWQAGAADWWNEHAVNQAVDQEVLHKLSSPQALLRALEHAGRTGKDPRHTKSGPFAAFHGDPEQTARRISAVKGLIFDGEYVEDPLEWDDSIPEPIQRFFEKA